MPEQVQVMTMTRDAKPTKLGTIRKVGSRVVFDLPEPFKTRLSIIKFEGKLYRSTDPKFMQILPLTLRGDYLWVENV